MKSNCVTYTDQESLDIIMKFDNKLYERWVYHMLQSPTLTDCLLNKIPTYMENQEQKQELTFGQKLVGLAFNPSQDDKVGKVKQLFAEITDILHEHVSRPSERSAMENLLHNHAVGEILNAQMSTVKVLTFK